VAANQRSRNDEAVEYIGRAVAIKNTVPSYHSNLGSAYWALGRIDQAAQCLQTAVRVDPEYAEGHQNLAVLLNEQGKFAEANQSLERVRQLKSAAYKPAPQSQTYTWRVIYRNFDEVPIKGTGHKGTRWAQATFEGSRRLLDVLKTYGSVPYNTIGYHNFLSMLAGIVTQTTGKVRILDFGGATGTAFLHMLAAMADPSRVEFHIVETESACELGEQLIPDDPRLKFHRAISDVPGEINIVHISCALQYVRDYKGLLADLCAFQTPYFLMPRCSAGDFPTFAIAQCNLWDDVVPYWFVNIGKLIERMLEHGYSLLFKGADQQIYDQSNFPPEYRMGRACNLLFGLKTADASQESIEC